MLRIGLISDTHGWIHPDLYDFFEGVDEIWHAGDIGDIKIADKLASFKPLKAVFGNVDGSPIRISYPEVLNFNAGGMKIMIKHIGGAPGKYDPVTKQLLVQNQPSIFVCGHSHIAKVMRDRNYGFLYLNPGAAGYQGFHKFMTAIRFSIDKGEIKDVELIELGERGRAFEGTRID